MPYINSKFITPVLFIAGVIVFNKQFMSLFSGGDIIKISHIFCLLVLAAGLAVASFIKNLSLNTCAWVVELLLPDGRFRIRKLDTVFSVADNRSG